MYVPGLNKVLALDADTGKEIWHYDVTLPSTRGVAYWPGDKDNPPRIVFTTFSRKVIALDANTGKPDPGFGKEGVVDMAVGYNGVPTIYKNLVIARRQRRRSCPLARRATRAPIDARTGAKLWDFHSVPQPGEVGHDTWLNDGWKGRSGINVWGWYMTVDAKRNILYMPIGGPAPNYYGGDRPGDNLFGNSVVAVDADTGKLKWHFQTIHHDLWDSDLPPAPGFVDITQHGKKIPALVRHRQDRLDVHPQSRHRQAGVRRRGAAGSQRRCAGRVVFAHAAVSAEAAAAGAHELQARRHGDGRRHHARACQGLPGNSREERRLLQRGSLHAAGSITKTARRRRATIQFPGRNRRRELGRHRGRSDRPATSSSTRTTWPSSAGSRRRKPGGNYGRGNEVPRSSTIAAASTGPARITASAPPVKDANGKVIGTWPCQKPPWGASDRDQREYRRHRLAVRARHYAKDCRRASKTPAAAAAPAPSRRRAAWCSSARRTDNRFRAFDSKTGKELWVPTRETCQRQSDDLSG